MVEQRRCRKHRYPDETSARLALATIIRKDKTHRPKTEARAYRCPRCRGYHLTSQEDA